MQKQQSCKSVQPQKVSEKRCGIKAENWLRWWQFNNVNLGNLLLSFGGGPMNTPKLLLFVINLPS